MTEISELARQFTTAYATVAPLKKELDEAVAAAQARMRTFARANRWGRSSWEYGSFVEAGQVSFTAADIDTHGIAVEYAVGQEYPTEAYLPFEVLANLDHYLNETAQRLREQNAFDARTAKDRKRAELVRQLAELDDDE